MVALLRQDHRPDQLTLWRCLQRNVGQSNARRCSSRAGFVCSACSGAARENARCSAGAIPYVSQNARLNPVALEKPQRAVIA